MAILKLDLFSTKDIASSHAENALQYDVRPVDAPSRLCANSTFLIWHRWFALIAGTSMDCSVSEAESARSDDVYAASGLR